jgi:hypothetical protein
MALAIAKHSVMGGMYTMMRDSGTFGIVVEVPLQQRKNDYYHPYEFEEIYHHHKLSLLSSLPIPTQQVHGVGFYGFSPAMGIFWLAEGHAFTPFSTRTPAFNKVVLTDDAGVMLEWLSQEYSKFFAYPFATATRIVTAWAPMVAIFQQLGRIYGDYERATARYIENNQGSLTSESTSDVKKLLEVYAASLSGKTE